MSTIGTSGLPGIQEIVKLAGLLRDTGDKVLSASSKLSLSTKLLADLNGAFSVIINETDDLESSFQVCNSSRNEVFRDIKFLHDFVQKTVGLKIQHNHNDMKVNVDISKFRHLKYLELQKVPLDMVKGIQGIRGQLECIVCSGGRGVNNVNELLAACGGDAGVGFIWGSLHRLALPYNALIRLDKSLEFAPWLETIDLSHNAITSAMELEFLPSLKNANLSFNNLESIPSFAKNAYHNLHKLILKNNNIDNIDGLHGLECLIELDLSYNCLTDHSMLWPLETMSMLLWLSLEGNPLSYHPRHRLHTIKHLHPSLSDSKFILDNEPLNKSQKLFVSENRVFGLRSSMHRASRRPVSGDSSLASSFTQSYSENPGRTEYPVGNRMTTSQNSDVLNRSIDVVTVGGTKSSSKTKRNVREAVIAEDDLAREQKVKPNSLSNSYIASMDHLETKRQILALRAKYGEDNWLSSHAAAHVQSIMGIEQSQPTPFGTSPLQQQQVPSKLASTPLFSAFAETQQSLAMVDTLTATTSMSPIRPASNNSESQCLQDEPSKMNNDKVEQRRAEREYESTDEGIVVETEAEAENEELAIATNEAQGVLETSYDPDEEKGDVYLVMKKKGNETPDEILLIVTPEDIKERDSMTGKIKYRWATNTVLSCVLGRGTPTTVDITFDTTRKDREARTYITELDDAKKIVKTLNEMINIQPLVLKVFKCMKCSTHFSQDGDNSIVSSWSAGAPPKCPTCKSTLVIQTDELPTPALDRLERIPEKPAKLVESHKVSPVESASSQLPHSSSQSSIDGTEGGAISITTSLVHFETHPQAQICCSATSLDESRESTPSASTNNTKKYESDIEILSNPSQSSIEVLDDGSKSTTPHRKKSSEERRVAVAPSLLTIPDTTLVMAGLTESSSSGSLTDSVCTAYENKPLKLLDKTEMSTSRSISDAETIKGETLDSENSFAPVTNLTSMLGELLQSMKIGPSKDSTLKSEESSEFVGTSIQYSYTNFSDVDHRIKLHIILNVFEHENEDLALLLRADILTQSSAETFPGCLVMSTAKVYILRINGPEGEDPQRWLYKESSWTIDRLRSFAPLPFKQGVLVELQQPNKHGETPTNNVVLCMLQDFQRTSNFLFYLTDSPLPASCEVEFMVPQYCNDSIKNILNSSKDYKEEDSIRLLALFSSATLTSPNQTVKLKVSGLIVTSSSLIIIQDKCHWLLPGNNKLPSIISEQGMSNLIEVDTDGNSLCLNFLDEVASVEATWSLDLVSVGAVEAIINSIRPPWEELFSVPLQINVPQKPSSSGTVDAMET